MEEKRERVLYYDILNIAACFCVICLHCCSTVFDFRLDNSWIFSLIVQVFTHWCVPVFFMLSGATLMGYRERYSTVDFFKRRFLKVFLPFLIWSTIYLIWKIQMKWIPPISELGKRKVLTMYLNNEIEAIFWFFYPLLGIYFSIPVLSVLREKKYEKILYYMVGFGIVGYSVLPLCSSLFGIYYNSTMLLPMLNGYLLYALTGWLLSKERYSRRLRWAVYLFGVVCAAVMFVKTYQWSVRDGVFNTTLRDYILLPTYGMSAAVFLAAKHIRWKFLETERARAVMKKLSGASFGIYLIHYIFLHLLFENELINQTDIRWMLAGPIGVYFVSLLIVLLVKKIPILKHLFP